MHMSVIGCVQAFVIVVAGKAQTGSVSKQATHLNSAGGAGREVDCAAGCKGIGGLSNMSILIAAVGNCRPCGKKPPMSTYGEFADESWIV
jgi:hypothetical protein